MLSLASNQLARGSRGEAPHRRAQIRLESKASASDLDGGTALAATATPVAAAVAARRRTRAPAGAYDLAMFATLLGALPRPPVGQADFDAAIRTAIAAQEEAGLEPLTDGRIRGSLSAWVDGDGILDTSAVLGAWTYAAAQTTRAVKQALPGPYTVGRRLAGASDDEGTARGAGRARGAGDRRSATTRAAESLRAVIKELAAAGCPLIEIEETQAHLIGADETERALFREAHERVTDRIEGTHLSLSIVGGSAWEAGIETIFDAPYPSLAVDLIAGPDNWNLVTRLPRDRGVIAGALPGQDSPADAKEMLLWAARYAAASNRRGLERVGIGSAGTWASLAWEAAIEKMRRLGEAAQLAQLPGGEQLARALDPRAVDARRAAMGHDPSPPRNAR